MSAGIIYVMTTAVSGLIKIGKARTEKYAERMRFLEMNGYYNVVGMKRFFAIEVVDYSDKETLLHEIFSKHRVGGSELFALDADLVKQLLLSFDGRIVYPAGGNKEKDFDAVARVRKQGERFSFYRKGIKNGEKIAFVSDDSIIATVVDEREVEYENQRWKLSPLTYHIFEKKNQLNNSGAYQGAAYFTYHGKKLKDIKDKD